MNLSPSFRILFLTAWGFLLFLNSAFSDVCSISNHLRLRLDPSTQEPQALETSIYRYAAKDTFGHFSIDLIAAVHVADLSYYEGLNRLFREYDAVLYELIAEREDIEFLKRKEHGDLSVLQNLFAKILDLSFQLDHINYSQNNFIHADMSAQELSESMQQRGESFRSLAINALIRSYQLEQKNPKADLSDLLLLAYGDYSSLGLKRILARQFDDISSLLNAINGSEGHSIIQGRNEIAIGKIREARVSRKRKIAIFYGAAHMPDFCERVQKEWSAKPEEQHWLNSWDLRLNK